MPSPSPTAESRGWQCPVPCWPRESPEGTDSARAQGFLHCLPPFCTALPVPAGAEGARGLWGAVQGLPRLVSVSGAAPTDAPRVDRVWASVRRPQPLRTVRQAPQSRARSHQTDRRVEVPGTPTSAWPVTFVLVSELSLASGHLGDPERPFLSPCSPGPEGRCTHCQALCPA